MRGPIDTRDILFHANASPDEADVDDITVYGATAWRIKSEPGAGADPACRPTSDIIDLPPVEAECLTQAVNGGANVGSAVL
jgi:hypothetical protein